MLDFIVLILIIRSAIQEIKDIIERLKGEAEDNIDDYILR